MTLSKKCPLCNCSKSVSEYHSYYSKERKKHRIGNYCKPCARANARVRATEYYENHRDERKLYARNYRAKEENKERLKIRSSKLKRQYRVDLKDCYIRDRLVQDAGIPTCFSRQHPEIIETKRLQIKINRKLKSLKNGKK